MSEQSSSEVVFLSPVKFLIACVAASAALFAAGHAAPLPAWLVAAEVMLTIVGLFVLGSMKYQLDKNALTYGMVLVIFSTFWSSWWPDSGLRSAWAAGDYSAVWHFFRHYFTTLHGLDELIHADTMLFILGLTFFVAMIAQTRILETISFWVLMKARGNVVVTVAILTGLVSLASGILDGVSMIGLMIRTLVIILLLSRTNGQALIFAVIVSTVVTTVCGMWLAYGEPPNLIMKANLHPHLTNEFFLRYCAPAAFASYLVVVWNLRKHLKGRKVDVGHLDFMDLHTDDVRYLQAQRHGEVLSPVAFAEEHREQIGAERFEQVLRRLQQGEPLGEALVHERVPEKTRQALLGKFVSEDLAESLDVHYHHAARGDAAAKDESLAEIRSRLRQANSARVRSQRIGMLAFLPFVGLLVWHAIDHDVPLFLASFAGFAVAFFAVYPHPKMRALALAEARHEFKEYFFLLPLFFSITLLQKTGFFNRMADLVNAGIESLGAAHMAYLQFAGATVLSAILDNNVVADFASRALLNLDVGILHLFAMAQIAGYAAGGCWTHIGSAQSVVAFSFIRREINEGYTPFRWIRAMTPVVLQLALVMTLIIYGEAALMQFLER